MRFICDYNVISYQLLDLLPMESYSIATELLILSFIYTWKRGYAELIE